MTQNIMHKERKQNSYACGHTTRLIFFSKSINNLMLISAGSSLIDDGSLFVECLRDHKLYLHTGETPHLLGVDQATFIKVVIKRKVSNEKVFTWVVLTD